MNCLKCGREIKETQVFCDSCLETMAAYPVKPGTAVHIPVRQQQEKRPAGKRVPSSRELLKRQRKLIRWLLLALAAFALVICVLAAFLLDALQLFPGPQRLVP